MTNFVEADRPKLAIEHAFRPIRSESQASSRGHSRQGPITVTVSLLGSSVALCAGFRFQLRLRDIEEFLLERGVIVTYAPKEPHRRDTLSGGNVTPTNLCETARRALKREAALLSELTGVVRNSRSASQLFKVMLLEAVRRVKVLYGDDRHPNHQRHNQREREAKTNPDF